MPGLHKWLTALAVVLLAAGVGGIVTHHRSTVSVTDRTGPSTTAPVTTTTTAREQGPPISVPAIPAGPAASSAALAAGMITPTDMGGYYRIDPTAAAAIVDSTPCLAGLSSSTSQAGRAQTALLGPNLHSVPTIVEVAASYTGQAAGSVYREVVAAVDACPAFHVTFGGTPTSVALAPLSIPQVGLADTAWSGTATYAGSPLRFQIGVVLDGHTVVAMLWVDSVPPADAVMGSFTSTLSAALGKLA